MPFSGPQAGEAAPWQPAHAPAADAAWTGPAEDPERAAGDPPPYGHPRDEHGATGLPAQARYAPGADPAAYGTGLPGTDARGTAYAPGGTDGRDAAYAPGTDGRDAHGTSYGQAGQGGPDADGIPFGSHDADGPAYGASASDGRGAAYAPTGSDGRGTAYGVNGADQQGTSYGSDGRGTAYGVNGADAHGTSYAGDGSDGRGAAYAPTGSDGRGTAYGVNGAGAHGTSFAGDGSDGSGAAYASDGAGYGPGGPAGGEDGHAYAASDAAASGSEGFGAEEPSGAAGPQPQPQPQPLPEAEPGPDSATGDAPGEHDEDPDAAGAADPADAPDAADADGTGAAALPATDPADDALPGAESAAAEAGPEAESEPEPEPVEETRSEHPLASYTLRVNGTERPVTDAWLGESLLYVLRERLGLAGAKDGCEQGECGACSVKVDGRLVASCLVPAATAAGAEVRTVEGLAVEGRPSDVQQALADCGAVQCGFCIPGMAMTVHDLLEGNHRPTDLEVRQALSGNLCRCSGYRGVLDAVRQVVADRAAEDDAGAADDAARVPHQGGPAGPEGAR